MSWWESGNDRTREMLIASRCAAGIAHVIHSRAKCITGLPHAIIANTVLKKAVECLPLAAATQGCLEVCGILCVSFSHLPRDVSARQESRAALSTCFLYVSGGFQASID